MRRGGQAPGGARSGASPPARPPGLIKRLYQEEWAAWRGHYKRYFKVAARALGLGFVAGFIFFTLVAIRLVDRLGRKPLMLAGSAGLAVAFGLIGASYAAGSRGLHILVLVVIAMALYALSLAPVPWVILSEIFPTRIRGAAMSVSTFSLWSACFILTYTFPLLNQGLGPAGTFWIYAGISVFGFVFIKSKVRETKGKTLEEIERELAGR